MKQFNIDNKYNPHSVTMSALAASTAIVRGVFSSMSAAFWLAPLFKNKHTCLKHKIPKNFVIFSVGYKIIKIATHCSFSCVRWSNEDYDDETWKTNPVCPSMVAWWRGPRPWASCWLTLAAFWSKNSQVTSEPWKETMQVSKHFDENTHRLLRKMDFLRILWLDHHPENMQTIAAQLSSFFGGLSVYPFSTEILSWQDCLHWCSPLVLPW